MKVLFLRYLKNEELTPNQLLILRRKVSAKSDNSDLFWNINKDGAHAILEDKAPGWWLIRNSSMNEDKNNEIDYKALGYSYEIDGKLLVKHHRLFHIASFGYGIFTDDGKFEFFASFIDMLDTSKEREISKHGVPIYAPLHYTPEDVREIIKDKRALLNAVGNNNIEEVRSLISENQKTILESRTLQGFTPLILAASDNRLEIAELLLNAKADLEAQNIGGFTALGQAAFNGHKEMIKLLVAHGANLFVEAKNGETIADIANRSEVTNKDEVINLIASETAKKTKKRKASEKLPNGSQI